MAKRAPLDAVTKAVALLSARERSRAQLESALRARGYSECDVVTAVERMQALGYLDDARVAAVRARQGLAEGRSQRDVARRLTAQGLEEGLALGAVEVAARAAGTDDETAARKLVAQRRVVGAKAARLLASRGFEEEVIRRVVDLGE